MDDVPCTGRTLKTGCWALSRASLPGHALALAILISLFAAIMSSGFMYYAYLQRMDALKKKRYEELLYNLESATALFLASDQLPYDSPQITDLYAEDRDTVSMERKQWGLYDIGLIRAVRGESAVKKAILCGKIPKKDYALYVTDLNRPLSLSGEVMLDGDLFLPAAGIKKAFIHGNSFTKSGDIKGKVKTSAAALPPLNARSRDALMSNYRNMLNTAKAGAVPADTGINSFFAPTLRADANRMLQKYQWIEGNFILSSAQQVRLAAGSIVKDAVLAAPSIVVSRGFKGSVQLMATDSIIIEPGAVLEYPSGIVLMKDQADTGPFIRIMEGAQIRGDVVVLLFADDPKEATVELMPGAYIMGSVYSEGYADIRGTIAGTLTCKKTIYRTESAVYENHLVDARISPKTMPPSYAGSSMFSAFPYATVIKNLK